MSPAGDDGDSDDAGPELGSPGTQRLDKWLWYTRAVKSRSLAQKLISEGRVRVNRERTDRPSLAVSTGDVVTFTLRDRVQVLKVVRTGMRRGPAKEARGLYEDLSPPIAKPGDAAGEATPIAAAREPGTGRPTKRERRQTDRLKDEWPGEN